MRSRVARLTFGALAWLAFGAAAVFLVSSEKHIIALTSAVRTFDLHAREATDALADVRAGQQAYVAEGQGVTFWMPKVAATTDTVTSAVAALRRSATSAAARSALDEAAKTLTDFADIDTRAREYLKAEQPLMAGDVIFTEGGASAANAARQVEAARLAEHQARDASEADIRRQQALAIGGAAGLAVLIVLVLALVPASRTAADTTETLASSGPSAPSAPLTSSAPVLKTAADLATDFGRVQDLDELTRLLARAAGVLDASGLVVWMGSATGADLRPVLAHGYAPQLLARMPDVPRSADNAAAAAYRTGSLQIVLSRPGGASGAIVAPILSADGCIGALSAEIRGGGETSESVQALAAIFASHLANVLASTPAETAGTKTAVQG